MKNILLIFTTVLLASNVFANGKLLIVGGALSSENRNVYDAFLKSRALGRNKIAIIPVASSKPIKSAKSFKQDLVRFGAKENEVMIFPLAVMDDPTTKVDERLWRDNAFDEQKIEVLDQVGAVWFTGGDQMRIINTLLSPQGHDSPLLKRLRHMLNTQGIVIGGTSAGAAMMSNVMIAAGDSFTALTALPSDQYYGMETQEQGQLFLHQGIGFFPYGIVDQHFDRKSRLGRLVKTLTMNDHHMGYGVDENTAMLINLRDHILTVIGAGNVTVVDTQGTTVSDTSILNVSLSVLGKDDTFHLKQRKLIKTQGVATVNQEYAHEASFQGGGMILPNNRLSQMLGFELLDNANSDQIRRYSFIETGAGILYEFLQTSKSQGYWRSEGTLDHYTIDNVVLNIKPVNMIIKHDTQPES